jgi:hypothetical protein
VRRATNGVPPLDAAHEAREGPARELQIAAHCYVRAPITGARTQRGAHCRGHALPFDVKLLRALARTDWSGLAAYLCMTCSICAPAIELRRTNVLHRAVVGVATKSRPGNPRSAGRDHIVLKNAALLTGTARMQVSHCATPTVVWWLGVRRCSTTGGRRLSLIERPSSLIRFYPPSIKGETLFTLRMS